MTPCFCGLPPSWENGRRRPFSCEPLSTPPVRWDGRPAKVLDAAHLGRRLSDELRRVETWARMKRATRRPAAAGCSCSVGGPDHRTMQTSGWISRTRGDLGRRGKKVLQIRLVCAEGVEADVTLPGKGKRDLGCGRARERAARRSVHVVFRGGQLTRNLTSRPRRPQRLGPTSALASALQAPSSQIADVSRPSCDRAVASTAPSCPPSPPMDRGSRPSSPVRSGGAPDCLFTEDGAKGRRGAAQGGFSPSFASLASRLPCYRRRAHPRRSFPFCRRRAVGQKPAIRPLRGSKAPRLRPARP